MVSLLVPAAIFVSPAAKAQNSMAFGFDITLSAKAASKLSSSGEGITVAAYYYGDPKKGAEKRANEVGQIDLGDEKVDLPGRPSKVAISGKIKSDALKWISGAVFVNVNIYSSRKKGPDNILSCDFIDNEVRLVTRQPLSLHCSLIEERVETKVKP